MNSNKTNTYDPNTYDHLPKIYPLDPVNVHVKWCERTQTINGKTYTYEQLLRKFPMPKECLCSMMGSPRGHYNYYKEFGGHLDSVVIVDEPISKGGNLPPLTPTPDQPAPLH